MKNELMIFEQKERAVVSSRVIADVFEKRHDNVLNSVRSLTGGILKNKDTPCQIFY